MAADGSALIAAGVSLLVALLTAAFQVWAYLHNHWQQRDKLSLEFKAPLLMAADELSGRITNLVEHNLGSYFRAGLPRQKEYVCENTVYLFCQYFAWQHIVKSHLADLNLSKQKLARLIQLLADVRNSFSTDAIRSEVFHLFGGEQGAFGEQLVVREDSGSRFTCISYLKFLTDEQLKDFVQPLRESVKVFIATQVAARESNRFQPTYASAKKRLLSVQTGLVALMHFLDPENALHRSEPSIIPSYLEIDMLQMQWAVDDCPKLSAQELEVVGIAQEEVAKDWLE